MLTLNHQQLYAFWVVAQEGGITRACRRLCLAQPTVSGQIIQLEKSLGGLLFTRDKNRLSLTDRGQIVLQHANTIFAATQDLLDSLKEGQAPGIRRLRLGIESAVTKPVALRCMRAARAFDSATAAMIHEGTLADLLRELQDREIDILLAQQAGSAGQTGSYRRVLVGRLPVFFCAAPQLARRCKAFPSDLADLPLLLPPSGHSLRHDIDRYLASITNVPQVAGEIADAELMRILALDGAGAAPLHSLAVAADLRAGRLLRLGSRPTGIFKAIWLIARTGPLAPGPVQHLFERFRLP